MTTETRIEELAKRDGCGCPPHVIRCAHFGASKVVIFDGRLASPKPCTFCNSNEETVFSVAGLNGGWSNCPGCGHDGYFTSQEWFYGRFDTETAANAAFNEAVERLLRGE